MKLLHLSDLHLGKQMNDWSLLLDQEAILQQIVSIADSEQVEAVLIAGDVYQRSSPQAEAMAVFDAFVSQLVQLGKKVFVISGNHDSAQRISYFSSPYCQVEFEVLMRDFEGFFHTEEPLRWTVLRIRVRDQRVQGSANTNVFVYGQSVPLPATAAHLPCPPVSSRKASPHCLRSACP